jgi:hypothetical protein
MFLLHAAGIRRPYYHRLTLCISVSFEVVISRVDTASTRYAEYKEIWGYCFQRQRF